MLSAQIYGRAWLRRPGASLRWRGLLQAFIDIALIEPGLFSDVANRCACVTQRLHMIENGLSPTKVCLSDKLSMVRDRKLAARNTDDGRAMLVITVMFRAPATRIRLKPPMLRLVGSKVIQPAPGA